VCGKRLQIKSQSLVDLYLVVILAITNFIYKPNNVKRGAQS
jgi:hypothetical protein